MLLKINQSPNGFVADELNSFIKMTENPLSVFNVNSIDETHKAQLFTILSTFSKLDPRISQVIDSLKNDNSRGSAVSIKLPTSEISKTSMKTFFVKNETDEIQLTAMNKNLLPTQYKDQASSYSFSFSHISDDSKYKLEGHLFNYMDPHKELIEDLDSSGFGFYE